MGEVVVSIRYLRHAYDGTVVLDIPEWSLEAGRHCLVLGSSGSGKTTFVNVLAGLIRPDAGEVSVVGQPLNALDGGAMDVFRGRTIGIVFQTLHLVRALDVADNLRLARYATGLPPDDARIVRTLDSLGLSDKVHVRPGELSQGEAQRVAIARAVINEPKLILADEPTSALDDASCRRVIDLLTAQADACGATLLIATHDQRIKGSFETRIEMGVRP